MRLLWLPDCHKCGGRATLSLLPILLSYFDAFASCSVCACLYGLLFLRGGLFGRLMLALLVTWFCSTQSLQAATDSVLQPAIIDDSGRTDVARNEQDVQRRQQMKSRKREGHTKKGEGK